MSRERRRSRRRTQEVKVQEPKKPVVQPGTVGGWYKPLKDPDVEKIHNAALDVLENIGIEVLPSEARDIFENAGAKIDPDKNRVYIPRELVEEALSTAQNEVLLAGRDPKHDMILGGQRVYMGTGGAAVKILDFETGHVRETVLKDVADVGRLTDALDNIHFYLRCCVARDLSNELLDINTFYASIVNTTKHVTGNAFTPESVQEVVELGSLVMGGREKLRERPILSFTNCWTVSPLRYAPETVEVLIEIIRQDVPVFISSAPQAGATSPAALAGTLVQIHAEEMSGITFCNLVKPGCPIILGYVPSVADLRTGNFTGGSAEFGMMNAAVAQLGQYCNLPVYNSSGLSDSKLPDVQAGYEKGITGLAAALAGSNYIHHSAGFLESLLTIAYEQFVIDDDINGSIMRMVRGIEVTDETLSLDVIEKVCLGEGHYLGTEQSLDLMNTEYYYPHTADRQNRDNWLADGGLNMWEAARNRTRHILNTHKPTPIDPAIDKAIRERFEIVM